MREIAATVTQRSQVTLPVEVQRALGIKARDKVIFAIEGDQVRLLPAAFTLESAAGSVSPLGGDAAIEVLIRDAKEERAVRKWRAEKDR